MKVGIIGTGKLAHQLAYSIYKLPSYELSIICGRSMAKAKRIINLGSCTFVKKIADIPFVDLLIISVSDDAIHLVSEQLDSNKNTIVVHTSGIKGIEILNQHKAHGILYPLYSFFDKKETSLKEVPFLLESNSPSNLKDIRSLAEAISTKVYEVNPADKKHLHLAAVFANNFGNFMMTTAHELLAEKDISKEILLPIIKQSCMNWMEGKAIKNQSGPALRGDMTTQENHLGKLTNTDRKEMYESISKAIYNFYK